MKLLLDTHVLLWSVLDPDQLSEKIRTELERPVNELWLSPITIWEVHLLAEKGRILLKPDPSAWIQHILDTIPFHEAAVTHAVALMSRQIDLAHQDPADRFLAATAAIYELTLVTADERLLHSQQFKTLAAR
ncbi:MAG: type II toxin-antitoxin system VapC family toxin [Nitrospira sp.]|jgi:PIN domain nuclease of toxin-antitoxin system|nr:type II toxin-antitoxin system VapC family toxin [Nitrospira sp.]